MLSQYLRLSFRIYPLNAESLLCVNHPGITSASRIERMFSACRLLTGSSYWRARPPLHLWVRVKHEVFMFCQWRVALFISIYLTVRLFIVATLVADGHRSSHIVLLGLNTLSDDWRSKGSFLTLNWYNTISLNQDRTRTHEVNTLNHLSSPKWSAVHACNSMKWLHHTAPHHCLSNTISTGHSAYVVLFANELQGSINE